MSPIPKVYVPRSMCPPEVWAYIEQVIPAARNLAIVALIEGSSFQREVSRRIKEAWPQFKAERRRLGLAMDRARNGTEPSQEERDLAARHFGMAIARCLCEPHPVVQLNPDCPHHGLLNYIYAKTIRPD